MKKDLKETLSEIQEKHSGLSWDNRTTPARFLIGSYALVNYLNNKKLIFGFVFTTICFVLAVPSTIEYDRQDISKGVNLGSGGPDFTVLGSGFSYPDINYTCDEGVWRIDTSADSTIVYYGQGTSTPLGSTFQIDFIPTGIYASNLVFSRPELYELIPGDNTFDIITLKDLRSGDFILLKNASTVSDFSKSVRLEKEISTSSINTIRIKEVVTSKLLSLTVAVNNEVFISDEILVENANLHKSLAIALLDADKKRQNMTGVFFPELSICP